MDKIKDFLKRIPIFFESENSSLLKKRQNLSFSITVLVLIFGVCVILFKTRTSDDLKKIDPVDVKKVNTSKESIDEKKVWVEQIESSMELIRKKQDQLDELVKVMSQKALVQETDHLKKEGDGNVFQQQSTLNNSDLDEKPKGENVKKETSSRITKIQFNLSNEGRRSINKSIEHYVPGGTFVRARLLSGVVASTSVNASSAPQPVHMELVDFGNLPRHFKTDLKKCFMIGSAYGDLPSERVFLRLETLSCVERKTEEVIEIKVDGYVSGEDGANGMRGHVIDRSGPAMRNAFLGGFIGGMGEFLGDKNGGVTKISPMGITSQEALSATEMIKGGAGRGVGNAMEKLSDFYIKRAEQLQPVIEIEPGREIDIVFKAGFDMNQTLYRQSLKNNRDRVRRSDVLHTFE